MGQRCSHSLCYVSSAKDSTQHAKESQKAVVALPLPDVCFAKKESVFGCRRGSVGERKVRVLLQYGAVIRLIAGELTPWLQVQCDGGTVQLASKSTPEIRWKMLISSLPLPAISPLTAESLRMLKPETLVYMATDPNWGPSSCLPFSARSAHHRRQHGWR